MLLRYWLLLSAFEPLSRFISARQNNVCKTFNDYYYPDDNINCYYDPDTLLQTPQLIKKYAGKVEMHEVVTEDGYILSMFRIPRERPKGVILLHHSIATYSHIYLWQGNSSLAITLWRNGYDVWLANQRGTTYSNRHVNLTSYDFAYWNFSFHEMGVYDVSSELKLIRKKTNRSKVIYFGHSLGSNIGLIYSSVKPEEASNYLKSMILLAPPAFFGHGTSLIYIFKDFAPLIQAFMEALYVGSPFLILPILLPISRIFLRLFPTFLFVGNLMIWAFCGYTPDETDPTFFNYDAAIYGNNFSWKTLYHFVQLLNSNYRFQMYDYGKDINLEIYGRPTPLLYPLEKISVPTLLVSSFNDTLISLKDTEYLYEKLPITAKTYGHWKIEGLNHLDYHTGLHRKEKFVKGLIEFLDDL